MPHKSGLSQMRTRVSFQFFIHALTKLLAGAQDLRRTFRGYHVYAIDGFQAVLPRTADVLKHGYVGGAVGQYRETYYPKMYVSHCYDVLSEVTRDVRFSPQNEELSLAEEIVAKLEKNSITLYDRLYPSARLVVAHRDAGNYFLARVSSKSFKHASALLGLKIKRRTAVIEGVKVRFFKTRNPRTGEWGLFMTNLPVYWVEEQTVAALYGLRWEVENSFRDWVNTLKLEQWHSTKMNGILQEFYASLWLANYARIHILLQTQEKQIDPLDPEYSKPNFKLILDTIIWRLKEIFLRAAHGLPQLIRTLIKRSTEIRKRRSRTRQRFLRGSPSPYPYNNQVWNPQFTGVLN